MKVAIIVLSLVALTFSAPQPRKPFHEHFEDFIDIIMEEVGSDLEHISYHYFEYDEFLISVDYLSSKNFKDLVYEMEALPEFQAVVDFLENDNIDIMFFIDLFNEMLESFELKKRARHETSGRDFTAYLNDVIALFPKEQLAALYDQKMSDDDEFRVAMENLRGDEWDRVFGALWESETFQDEVNTLKENGIDVSLLITEILAIFGQNK